METGEKGDKEKRRKRDTKKRKKRNAMKGDERTVKIIISRYKVWANTRTGVRAK